MRKFPPQKLCEKFNNKFMKKLMKFSLFVTGFLVGLASVHGQTFAAEGSLLSEEEKIMGRVFMKAEILEKDILKISVMAADMQSPILGTAFHLNYEGDRLKFLRYDPGEFLERGGDPVYLVKDYPEKENLVFGETLRRDDSFPAGGGEIASFYFQITGEKKFVFSFQDGVVSTMNTVRQDLDRIVWEDFSFDENAKEKIGEEKIDKAESGWNFLTQWSGKKFLFTLVGLSFMASIGMIFLLKKSREKSVNFK